ncbi:UvrD-helicase domain-containing protein [Galbibacter sp. PAP.153]|uniref:UvrD-helicase domain-containing protein n=1 Tax=Galbibacter sp. PAP.153 TaxID=3104623 RepID=UPI00300A6547
MLNSSAFQIYNASAGSGKTFTLVKKYLSILLGSNNLDAFKQVLAITFTNKAVNEMKERVLKNLHEFSGEAILEKPTPIFEGLVKELNVSPMELHEKSKKVLTRILHNYAFFDIVTIDKFNHRLLRTFAFDLKLPTNFEVSLDEESLINEAVDNLIFQAGSNQLLTEILINFALEKTDDDKSWDISRDLRGIAKLLTKEDYIEHVQLLEDKTLEDFKKLGLQLKEMNNSLQKSIVDKAIALLHAFSEKGLEDTDFTGKYLPKFLRKIASNDFSNLKFTANWQENIANQPLYPKRIPDSKATLIDMLQPEIATSFLKIKQEIFQLEFLQDFYKNLVPLSLLNAINQELKKIKEDRNLLLISEFNKLISSAIANQPAPFIYERIGEKYKHYFIDEFQDTSTMQWKNIQPLVSNALETMLPNEKTGTLLIVGDAKQAIYRWRGGKAEQFIALYNKESKPFQTEQFVENLPKNYRSFDEIVTFNNEFFKHISQNLKNETYRDLFKEKSTQQTNGKPGGYIDISFIDKEEDSENDEDPYCNATLDAINKCIAKGFNFKDIAILTRKKNEGVAIADYLLAKDIPIVSSETLLLKNDIKVNFIIQLISYFNRPDDPELHLEILKFLAHKNGVENLHDYFAKNLYRLSTILKEEGFDETYFLQLPFYNAIEYSINSFNLVDKSDAHIQFFLDEVFAFAQNNNGSIGSFLEYWDQKKDKLSIVAPQASNAVQILTIHKSKGLEFPVVIYPYANTDIYREKDFKVWFPVDLELFGVSYALFSKKSAVENINQTGADLIQLYKEKQELDQFNILYVALTRAVEQLYIICKKDSNAKGIENQNSFAGLFINYLKAKMLWQEQESNYKIGIPQKQSRSKETTSVTKKIEFISNDSFGNTFQLITKSGSLWNTKQKEAIDKGNIYHYLLSKIYYTFDIAQTVTEAVDNGLIPKEEQSQIQQYLSNLVAHPLLKEYYTQAYTIYNESEIMSPEGQFLRPDRFVVKNNKATIIDYKTGAPSEKYKTQVNNYANVLKEAGFEINQKFLVFINENIEVISV